MYLLLFDYILIVAVLCVVLCMCCCITGRRQDKTARCGAVHKVFTVQSRLIVLVIEFFDHSMWTRG